jgi:hypothetical protein
LIILSETEPGFKSEAALQILRYFLIKFGGFDFFVRSLTTESFVTSINENGNFKNACCFFLFQSSKVIDFPAFRPLMFSPKKSGEKFL